MNHINLLVVKHPIDSNNIINFDINKFINNNNKILLQIGQQLRKITSIYDIKTTKYKKIWLTGNKSMQCSNIILNRYIKYNDIKDINLNDVTMYYTNTYEEYDLLLEKNIVFVDLIDAGANNVVLECIIRNTPLIINKLPGVVDYLGENYPLYFENINDVSALLDNEKIITSAYLYLKNMDKTELTNKYFYRTILNNIHKNIR
jgi:hypothetical protein